MKQIKNIEDQKKSIDNNGYAIPKQVNCFKCKEEFWLKFSVPQQNYVRKNLWSYWTEQTADQKKYICNSCLKGFYLNQRKEFLVIIKSLKKRNHLRSYVSHNVI